MWRVSRMNGWFAKYGWVLYQIWMGGKVTNKWRVMYQVVWDNWKVICQIWMEGWYVKYEWVLYQLCMAGEVPNKWGVMCQVVCDNWRVTWKIWMRGNTSNMNGSCTEYGWVMSQLFPQPHMRESFLTNEWVMSHIWTSHVPHLYASLSHVPTLPTIAYEGVIPHKGMSHVPHMNESCPIYVSVLESCSNSPNTRQFRVTDTQKMPCLCRSFSSKQPCN